jgi:hypothetical protein
MDGRAVMKSAESVPQAIVARLVAPLAASLAGWLFAGCAQPAPRESTAMPTNASEAAALRPPSAAAAAGMVVAAPPPAVRSFPTPPQVVQGWIDRMDLVRIRAHAWDLWASITSPSPYPGLPVWETWYSGHELFELGPAARTAQAAHTAQTARTARTARAADAAPAAPDAPAAPTPHYAHLRDFEFARQLGQPHSRSAAAAAGTRAPLPGAPAERPTAFNRYSPSVAHSIWDKGLNNSQVLDRINDEFDRARTPVALRVVSSSVGAVDAASVVLKPVFQFVAGNAPSAIPVWTGISPAATTNLANPSADTWRRCVVLDPLRTHPPGTTMVMPCNAEPARAWPVVSLAEFYAIRLTAETAAAYSQFAAISGDDIGQNNKTDRTSVMAMVKPGNLALLMAMHVTGKEIANWTWQTFWWALDPQDPLTGGDRPAGIGKPWSRYNMGTAYYMVSPPTNAAGEPLVSFNPYLETNLQGTVAGPGGTQIAWTGVNTNCMSCHRMAAWKRAAQPGPGQWGDSPAYQPDGLIDPADAVLFSGYVKLDFLWSLTRAQPPAAR